MEIENKKNAVEIEVRIGQKLTKNCIQTLFKVDPFVYPYPDMVQFKILNTPLKTTQLYAIFSKLKKLFKDEFAVVVLFVSETELQVIIGEPEAVKKSRFGQNTTDFALTIC